MAYKGESFGAIQLEQLKCLTTDIRIRKGDRIYDDRAQFITIKCPVPGCPYQGLGTTMYKLHLAGHFVRDGYTCRYEQCNETFDTYDKAVLHYIDKHSINTDQLLIFASNLHPLDSPCYETLRIKNKLAQEEEIRLKNKDTITTTEEIDFNINFGYIQ
ncbi:MAG: hypothetical protein EZS28_004093 [Streblomastix strix]|uniref:C2H2-type domain-containing protein n=1 Tax=Streblomastix strix TaxID=222440 RepID=A0A5J4X1R4_9EUKA|nr:MAG: hypothetical protein EZS28_004093 [Streblomastix strix]